MNNVTQLVVVVTDLIIIIVQHVHKTYIYFSHNVFLNVKLDILTHLFLDHVEIFAINVTVLVVPAHHKIHALGVVDNYFY